MIPVWGDRNGAYTSFAIRNEAEPCFAIFAAEAMPMFDGYEQPLAIIQPDTIVGIIPSNDLDADYLH